MTFRVDGVSASYPQWQRSCCCDGRSVGKLDPGRVCGVLLTKGTERHLTINEEEDEEQEEARYLAMKASASARPAGGVKIPRDVVM